MSALTLKHHLQPISHHFPSYALLAEEVGTETAVIFVHGFGGDSVKTWRDFQRMMDECNDAYPWWKTYDAFFYEYNSLTKPVAVTAHHLLAFIESVFPLPDPVLFTVSSETASVVGSDVQGVRVREGVIQYRNLVLVGHSEGAVLIRRAVLEKIKILRDAGGRKLQERLSQSEIDDLLTEVPMLSATLVLFAPAYLGASCSGWTGALLHFSKLINFVSPILNFLGAYVDLQKDSPVLKSIREDTEEFARTFPWMDALIAKSVFGEEDRIVYLGEYLHDMAPVLLAKRNHLSVCKPAAGYEKPLELVRYEPKRRAANA
jgi:pimeloyl-ACP methyl ester carboxylesterase